MAILKRILSRVKKEQRREFLDPCWIWQGFVHNTGYARVNVRSGGIWTNNQAHRYVYSLLVAEVPHGYYVCHICDEKACVNPEHLFAGTPSDNAKDSVRKGHQRNPKQRLNEDQVFEIRALFETGTRNVDVAKVYGMSKSAVLDIKFGRSWKHLLPQK